MKFSTTTSLFALICCATLIPALAHSSPERALTHKPSRSSPSSDPSRLPPGVLSGGDIAKFAFAKAEYELVHMGDQFAAPFNDTPLVGRLFKLTTPVDEFAVKYDRETSMLRIILLPRFLDDSEFASDENLKFGAIASDTRLVLAAFRDGEPSRDEEANAFGATVDVPHTEIDHLFLNPDVPNDPSRGKMPIFLADIKLPPDKAREIAQHGHFLIEGTVSHPVGRGPVMCGSYIKEATLSKPYAFSGDNCVIDVSIATVELINPSGELVATMRSNNEVQP